MQSEWRALITEAIAYGERLGVFHPARNVEQIAMHVAAACEGTVFPVWMNNPAFDILAFQAYLVEDLSSTLRSHPQGSTNLDDIEERYARR